MDEVIGRLEKGEDPDKLEEEFGDVFDKFDESGGAGENEGAGAGAGTATAAAAGNGASSSWKPLAPVVGGGGTDSERGGAPAAPGSPVSPGQRVLPASPGRRARRRSAGARSVPAR